MNELQPYAILWKMLEKMLLESILQRHAELEGAQE